MPSRFSPHLSNSPHGSGDPTIQWTSPAGVRSELTGRLACRVRCRAMRRNSPCWFYLPNPWECLGHYNTPFGVPSEDWPTSHNQDVNLRCVTHPAHHTAALLPGTDNSMIGTTYYPGKEG
ncbi:UNVERIFIED_CONTAM: hypothetical protein FKN15_028417 [Acipenser sinensis]